MLIKLTIGQVFSQPVVPFSFLLSFSGLIGFFFLCIHTGFTKTDKQISWILTFASSLVCTVVSIPYFIQFWLSGWDMTQLGTDSNLHIAMVCFFISYLVLDLSLGSVYYKSRITVLTGWVHHPLYICILFWLLRCQSSSFFSTNGLLELPTLILALGSFRDRWRCDLLFAASFFMLRLVFHTYMIVALKHSHRLDMLWMVAVAVFPLHLYWFYGIVSGQIKKYAAYHSTPSPLGREIAARRPKHAFLDKIYTI
ncbi:uncharacterized protein B0P05DRAFT_57089 [Gilbertella persicaria]|uniref:TLC domain-containing protein n=1 Tax=Rhizopus stolonifer TaxID=4846 RepID=A0A367KN00_RHIST|nr:uncharacterized protein B0P05DRAFT_57089 [Gilbertella persicaria]KAI8082561.1 hypothetical protein B0P05DRAFT_57089 [Gilbertella persicaria]RCI03500.1 hypothetical protein CU098_010010 [Rhizopus stolonifer]